MVKLYVVLGGYWCTVYYINISQSIIGNVDVLEKLLCTTCLGGSSTWPMAWLSSSLRIL